MKGDSMSSSQARASRRWITLLLYMALWAAVGFLFRQWEIFVTMTIPIVSLGGGYILGETWRPSESTKPSPTPNSEPKPEPE